MGFEPGKGCCLSHRPVRPAAGPGDTCKVAEANEARAGQGLFKVGKQASGRTGARIKVS